MHTASSKSDRVAAPGRRSEFLQGVKDTFPLVVGAVPFGIIFGAVAITVGFSVWGVMGLSLLVFAGSAQLIAVGLVAQGVSVGFIVLTTFVVNLRHALYAASLGVYMKHLPQRWLAPLGFWLTDEAYAIAIRRYARRDGSAYKHWYYLGSALFMYGNWQVCTALGIVAGQQLKNLSDWGLEYAMVITFIGIVVPFITTRPMLLCAAVAGALAMFTGEVPNQMGLMIAAVGGITAGVLAELRLEKRKRAGTNS